VSQRSRSTSSRRVQYNAPPKLDNVIREKAQKSASRVTGSF
jgi:hypothetical protein